MDTAQLEVRYGVSALRFLVSAMQKVLNAQVASPCENSYLVYPFIRELAAGSICMLLFA
jgi:hypothetical protein